MRPLRVLAAIGVAGLMLLHGPVFAPLHVSGHLEPPGRSRAGVDYAVTLTSSIPLHRNWVAMGLSVWPPLPVRLRRLSPHAIQIRPVTAWPPQSRIRLRYGPSHVHFTTDDDRLIRVNLTYQTLTAYRGGIPVQRMLVSTGVAPDWVTPTGKFAIFRKVGDDHMRGGTPPDDWDVDHVPWAQYFQGGVAIHGAWWNHHLGVPRSHGCIQLSTRSHGSHISDAQWLWEFTDIGTPVVVTGQTPQNPSPPLDYPLPAPVEPSPTCARCGASSIR